MKKYQFTLLALLSGVSECLAQQGGGETSALSVGGLIASIFALAVGLGLVALIWLGVALLWKKLKQKK